MEVAVVALVLGALSVLEEAHSAVGLEVVVTTGEREQRDARSARWSLMEPYGRRPLHAPPLPSSGGGSHSREV